VPWVVVMAILQVILLLLVPGYSLIPDFTSPSLAPSSNPWVVNAASDLAYLVANASITVSWQRYLLLEVDGESDFLRLDRPVRRYFGNSLLLSLVLWAAVYVCIFALTIVFFVMSLAWRELFAILVGLLLLAAAFCCLIVLYLRLGLKLTAVSIGAEGYGFRRAWADTRGRKLGLFSLALICGLAFALPSAVLALALSDMLSGTSVVLANALNLVWIGSCFWLDTIFMASLTAVLYAVIAEGREI